MPSSLSIHAFDLDTIKPYRKHLFVGGSGRGKSHCCFHVISHIAPTVDVALLMCPTETTRALFQRRRLLPTSLMYDNLDLDVIGSAISVQRELRQRGKQRHLLLILDDCSFDKKAWKHAIIGELLRNGRHLNITTFITCQYVLDLPPDARSNIDFVYACADSCYANVKRLHECFFGCFKKADEMHRVHSACTKDFSLLVADCTQVKVESPSDMIFYHRAPAKLPKMDPIGLPVYWKLEQRRHFEREQAAKAPNQPVVIPATDTGTDKLRRALVDAI
jgi:hypothetical protein